MEIIYCDNCACKIAGPSDSGALYKSSEGKVYCSKCAPLFQFTTSQLIALKPPAPEQAAAITSVGMPSVLDRPPDTKFYFCEKCGKRVTEKDLAQGLGRDKKVKGVYCKNCAAGVLTVEFEAIDAPAPAAKNATAPTAEATAPVAKVSAAASSANAAPNQPLIAPPTNSKLPLIVGSSVAAAAIIGLIVVFTRSDRHQPASSPTPPSPAVVSDNKAAHADPVNSKAAQNAGEYSFNFAQAGTFERFKKFFSVTEMKPPMELKSVPGLLQIERDNVIKDSDNGGIHLHSPTVKFGKHWDLKMMTDFHIATRDISSNMRKQAYVALRFLKPGERAGVCVESNRHFSFRFLAANWGGSFDATWGNFGTGKDSIDGIQLLGKKPHFKIGDDTPKPPVSADGVYAIHISMHQDSFKMMLNGLPVAEYQLSQEAITVIADSNLAIFFGSVGRLEQISIKEFSFANLDNTADAKQN